MTSMGEISAARITMPGKAVLAAPWGDFRSALTTSLTPRLRVLFLAAAEHSKLALLSGIISIWATESSKSHLS